MARADSILSFSMIIGIFFGQSLEGTNIHQWAFFQDHCTLKAMFVSATAEGKQRHVNITFLDAYGQCIEGSCYCLVDDADPSGIMLAVRFKKQDQSEEGKEKTNTSCSSSAVEGQSRVEGKGNDAPQQKENIKGPTEKSLARKLYKLPSY